MGMILIRFIFSTFSDNLLQLLTMAFNDSLFSFCCPVSKINSIQVSKVFDLKGFRYLKLSKELKGEHCCFYHFLMGKKRNMSKGNDLEFEIQRKKELGAEINNYRAFMRRYFEDHYTEETENFLCFSTRFEEDERISIEQAFNHMFLTNFDSSNYIRSNGDQLNKVLQFFIQNDNLEISKMYTNSILKNLCKFYEFGERYYELVEDDQDKEGKRQLIEKSSSLIQFLSYELGVNKDYLWNRLLQLQNSSFKYLEEEAEESSVL